MPTQDRVEQTRWLAVLAMGAGALYLCWTMLRPFVGVLVTAVVLVIVFYPVHEWLSRKVKRSGLAALFSTLALVLMLVVPLVVASVAMARQLPAALTLARDGVDTLVKWFEESDRLRPWVESAKQQLNLDQFLSSEEAARTFSVLGHSALRGTWTVLGGVLGFVFNAFLVLFTVYYLFRDGTPLASNLMRLLPLKESQVNELTGRVREVIRASVYGVLVIAVVQGVLGGAIFWILGIPAAATWMGLMIIASIIPVFGASIIIVPAMLYLLATGHPVKAVVLGLFGQFVIGLVDNLLRPRLVGRRTGMHELLVFFSVLGGLQAFGALGFLLGPSVLALTLAMVEMLQLSRSATPPAM